jgi:hypothetical protein
VRRAVLMTGPNDDQKPGADDVPEELKEAGRQELEYPADESDEG